MKSALFFIALILLSCETKENIDVKIDPEPIQFHLSVPIDPLEVENQFSDIEDVNVIGGVFGELAEMMGNAEIEEGDLGNFAFRPCLYEISEIEQIDFDYVRSITLTNVTMKIESDEEAADFSFVEYAQGFIRPLSVEEYHFLGEDYANCADEGIDDDSAEEIDFWNLDTSDMTLAMDYRKDRMNVGDTISANIYLKDWRDILSEKRHLLLFFKVKIDRIPDYEFKIDGDIDLNIDIDLKSNAL